MKFREEAVSPVVGVMLMLVVTLILSAVVSAYVGSSGADVSRAPQASIAVYTEGTDDFNIVFEHRGGEFIKTEDIEIITWLKKPDGTMVKHKQMPDSPACSAAPQLHLPYLYESEDETSDADEFGKAVWMPGCVAGTGDKQTTAEFLGVSVEDLDKCIMKHAALEVDIMHRPSCKFISKSELVLRE